MFEPLSREVWDNRDEPKTRAFIVEHYLKLVEIGAAKARSGMPNFVDIEELQSMGNFGLLEAIGRFDFDRGLKFETFAGQRIYGSIIDGLRSDDWVPRSVRNKQKIVNKALVLLEEAYLRTPTIKELSEETGIDEEEVSNIIFSVQQGNVLKLDAYADQDEEEFPASFVDTMGQVQYDDGSMFNYTEVRKTIVQSINSLPEKQKAVITFYYYQGMSLVEISKVFGITQSRVSQLYSKGMKTIYENLVN